jgi:ABC-2 type transport system permease protein
MNRTYLIARQEFIKYITRRGFFISLLAFPMWIVLAVVVPRWMASTLPQRAFAIVDRAGGYEELLRETLDRNLARRQLLALSQYAAVQARAKAFTRAEPSLAALLSAPNDEASVKRFRAMGGVGPMLAALSPFLKPGAPPFVAPELQFVPVAAPAPLVDAPQHLFPIIANRYLSGDQHTGLPPDWDKLYAIVVIPKNFGAGATRAQFFTKEVSDSDLSDRLQQALTSALRLKAAHRLVPSGTEGAEALDVAADLQASDPGRSNDKQQALTQIVTSYLPVAMAILLFIVSMMNASVLLQGVIEEKSSRMIEVLLSCATPRQILTGKLAGVIAVSLVTIIAWGLMLIALALFATDDAMTMLATGAAAVLDVNLLPLLIVYFLCQILIYGAIFLGIGSMANSLADAQALLGPTMIILILPNLLIGGIMRDPSGEVARIASWIPIYTPFLMLIRLASHPPALELWGTALLSIATTIALILFVSRIFARHVLTTERPPALRALLRRVFSLAPARGRGPG